MTTPDLLPCPFCGGEATTWIGRDYFYVGCDECEAESAEFTTKEKAIAAWNTRANRDEVEDIVMISGLTHIIEAMTEERRWIPVSERLPKFPPETKWERYVLCTVEFEGKRHVTEMYFTSDGFFESHARTFTAPEWRDDGVRLIAWQYMPLPLPPKEVEE